MLKTTFTLLLVTGLILIFGACAPLTRATPEPNSLNTAIANTQAAMLTQTSQPGIPVTGLGSATPTPFALSPTASPTVTVSPTPFSTATVVMTATSTTSQVSVSVATNCRTGPGVVYDRVGALLVGQVVQVVGRNAIGNYWLINNPDRPGEVCWLWGQFASVSGNTSALPVVTPPPSPTPMPSPIPLPSSTATASPDVAAVLSGKESCTGTGWWVEMELQNNSGMAFESIAMTVDDTTNNTVLSLQADDFTDKTGCNQTNTRNTLAANSTLMVSSPVFTYDPTGHALRMTITLCSNPGQNGTCVTKVLNFTP